MEEQPAEPADEKQAAKPAADAPAADTPAEPTAEEAGAEEEPAAETGGEAEDAVPVPIDADSAVEPEPAPNACRAGSGCALLSDGEAQICGCASHPLLPGSGTFVLNASRSIPTSRGGLFRRWFASHSRRPAIWIASTSARGSTGWISSQADAVRHGIAKALIDADPNLRGELKRRQFLTRDRA